MTSVSRVMLRWSAGWGQVKIVAIHENMSNVWLENDTFTGRKIQNGNTCVWIRVHISKIRLTGKARITQSLYGLAVRWTVRIRFSEGAGTSVVPTMCITGMCTTNFIQIVLRYLRVGQSVEGRSYFIHYISFRVMYGTAYFYELVLTHRYKLIWLEWSR
jgi:hypothetical protein